MDRQELETYQVQLSQVELALITDPDNQELTSLRSELKELISLTEATLAAEAALPASIKPEGSSRKAGRVASSWSAGDECLAKYSGDGSWYPARITSIGGSEDHRVYSVVFKGYNTTELVVAAALKALPPTYQTPAPVKRKLTKEEEEEREKKKKKNEKKLEVKAQKAKEQNSKQATWQKFAKKQEKKGTPIAGIAGASIFKTPDNPLGKVGVTGSGKGMTEYAARNKHKFEVTADDR